ncbi:MAG: hypothetical protein VX399_06540, partial [SAR324 cluster bacterium]|nr:hypothetical protein [SAR324 cluster bacterium]
GDSDSKVRLELITFFSLSDVFLHNPSFNLDLEYRNDHIPLPKSGIKSVTKSVDGLLQWCFTKKYNPYYIDIID